METIIVGVDGGEPSKTAAREAAALAEATGAKVHYVVVVPESKSKKIESGADTWEWNTLDEARRSIEEFVESLPSGGDHEVLACTGAPAKALLDEAARARADLIVVGNRRMQGLGRILGSVGNDIAHKAPCSVLVVKTT